MMKKHFLVRIYIWGTVVAAALLSSSAWAQSQPAHSANLNNIRFADQFPGADAGAKVAAAIADLPASGGTVDAGGFEGSQTITSSVPIDKPVRLKLGAASFTCSANPCFDITSGNLIIEGQGRATKITSASAGTIFQVNDSLISAWLKTPLIFRNMDLEGAGSTSRAVYIPYRAFGDSQILFQNLYVHNFGSASGALEFGETVSFVDVNRCTFLANVRSLQFSKYEEVRVQFSEFYDPQGGAQLRVVGNGHAWIEDNEFFYGPSGSGTGPDIYIEALDAAGSTGQFIRIARNKFGSENEVSGRYKIEIGAADSTYLASGPIWITENDFGGSSDYLQKAIGVTIPAGQVFIEDNQFSLFGTLVDDIADLTTVVGTLHGMGTFLRNYHRTVGAAWTTFTNGGRCFNKIELPLGESAPLASAWAAIRQESPQLTNRLLYSEDFDSWTKFGVTVTSGQTDPFGGTRACLLTRAGSSSSEYVRANLDATAQTDQIFFRIWLKAGSLTTVSLRLYDNTASKRLTTDVNATLSSSWREFKIPWHGMTAAHAYSVFILVGGEVQQSGTAYAFGAQASDYDSSYYPTSGVAVYDSAHGARFSNGVLFGRAYSGSVNTVTFSTKPTFDASLGNTQKITLTDNVTSSTLSNPTAGQTINFIICQDGTGGRRFVWPTNVKGAMTIGSTASKCNAQDFIFDGTNAYAVSPGITDM
jgi:hypothetical protein